jgi:hypothetical protein
MSISVLQRWGDTFEGSERRLKPKRFIVSALSNRPPLSLVFAQLGRALTLPPENVALPDSFGLAPDQVQELRYGQGREQ